MQDSIGSLAGRAALAACLLACCSTPVPAQSVVANPPQTVEFMPRYDFHLSGVGLADEDDRFSWDAHFGGDFDFIDYARGRLTFIADYQAVIGREMRLFDVNQGNYVLAAAASVRAGATELVAVLHHVSRHLSDRSKTFPIAWNEVDGRVLRRLTVGGGTLNFRASIGKVTATAGVDYSWTGEFDATFRRAVGTHVSLFGRGGGRTVGVDDDVTDRGQQYGGRLEGGVRLQGSGGALELFGGFERVIDAHPLDRQTRSWPYAGFRLVTN
jgi:hypothetical protein